MSVSVIFAGNTYSIPETGETGWGALTDYLVALASASTTTTLSQNIRTSTNASTSVLTTDFCVLINVASAATVTLPAGTQKQMFYIGDVSGAAFTNNITINTTSSQNIDNQTSYVIKSNYGGLLVQFDGTRWKVLAEFLQNQITHKNNTTNVSVVDAAILGRTAFASVNNGQSCTVTFAGSNHHEFVISLDSGEAIHCATNYLASTVSALSDASDIFINAASGSSQIAVSKSASSHVVTIVNNMGSTKTIEVRALTSRVSSATAWA